MVEAALFQLINWQILPQSRPGRSANLCRLPAKLCTVQERTRVLSMARSSCLGWRTGVVSGMNATWKPCPRDSLARKRSFLFDVLRAALVSWLLCAVTGANGRCNAQTVLYRLNSEATFQQGCFAPCECAILLGVPVKGTFLLTPQGFDPLFTTYAVTEVNWSIQLNGTATVVTGSGTYKIGGEFALQQQLTLDLQVGEGNPARFDSGLVVVSVTWPNINAIISTNRQFCYDTVFTVSASPMPVPQLRVGSSGGGSLAVSWPVSSNSFVLQESFDLTPGAWTPVTNAPTVVGQQNQVVLSPSTGNKFYRLRPSAN